MSGCRGRDFALSGDAAVADAAYEYSPRHREPAALVEAGSEEAGPGYVFRH